MNFDIFTANMNYILKTKYNNHHPSFQEDLKLSNGMIGKYIKGQKPSVETLDKLKQITGFSIDDLLYKDLSKKKAIKNKGGNTMEPKEYTIKESDYSTLLIQITDTSVCFTRKENYRDSKKNSNEEFKITNIDKNYISKVEYSSNQIIPNNFLNNFALVAGIVLCVFGIALIPVLINTLGNETMLIMGSTISIFIFGLILTLLSIILRKKSQVTSNFNVYGKSDELLYSDEFYVEDDFIHEIIEKIYKK